MSDSPVRRDENATQVLTAEVSPARQIIFEVSMVERQSSVSLQWFFIAVHVLVSGFEVVVDEPFSQKPAPRQWVVDGRGSFVVVNAQ